MKMLFFQLPPQVPSAIIYIAMTHGVDFVEGPSPQLEVAGYKLHLGRWLLSRPSWASQL